MLWQKQIEAVLGSLEVEAGGSGHEAIGMAANLALSCKDMVAAGRPN